MYVIVCACLVLLQIKHHSYFWCSSSTEAIIPFGACSAPLRFGKILANTFSFISLFFIVFCDCLIFTIQCQMEDCIIIFFFFFLRHFFHLLTSQLNK